MYHRKGYRNRLKSFAHADSLADEIQIPGNKIQPQNFDIQHRIQSSRPAKYTSKARKLQKRTSSIHEHETHTQKHKFETWRGDHQGTKENTKARFPYITNNIEKIIIRIFIKIYIYIYIYIYLCIY